MLYVFDIFELKLTYGSEIQAEIARFHFTPPAKWQTSLPKPKPKPLDEATILREAGEAVEANRLVITAENHSVVGGLGEAIAGVLMRNNVTPRFKQIALPDAFLAAGALPTLHDRYGISTEAMVKQITAWLAG